MKSFEDKTIALRIGGRTFEYRAPDSVLCRWNGVAGRYQRGNEGPRCPDHRQIEKITRRR